MVKLLKNIWKAMKSFFGFSNTFAIPKIVKFVTSLAKAFTVAGALLRNSFAEAYGTVLLATFLTTILTISICKLVLNR